MDSLTYIRKALTLLSERGFPHFLRIGPLGDAMEIGSLSILPDESGGSYWSEYVSGHNLEDLATVMPELLRRYGLDYPRLPDTVFST